MPTLEQFPSYQIDPTQVAVSPATSVPNFRMEVQKVPNWCWAAVAASVSKCLASQGVGDRYEQCQIANKVLPGPPPQIATTDCCQNGGTAPCPAGQYNVEADLGIALMDVQHLNDPPTGRLDFATIEKEILAKRPVCIRFAYATGDAHLLVIFDAHREASGIAYYGIADPRLTGPVMEPAETLPNTYQGQAGTWTTTYLTQ